MATLQPTPPIDTTRRRMENQLYREIYPLFVDYYSAKVRKYALARELAVEAMAKVMTKLSGYNKTLPLQNWAMRVARNHLIDYYRQRASHKHQFIQPLGELSASDQETASPVRWFEEHAETQAEQEYQLLQTELLAELAAWPGQEGDIVRAHLLKGEDAPQIAKQLVLKPKVVKRVIAEAKLTIRGRLMPMTAPASVLV